MIGNGLDLKSLFLQADSTIIMMYEFFFLFLILQLTNNLAEIQGPSAEILKSFYEGC